MPLEPADDVEEQRAPRVHSLPQKPGRRLRICHVGDPQRRSADGVHAFEAVRHDADYRERLVIERDRASHDRPIAAEPPLPHVVAKDRDEPGARHLIFVGHKASADERLRAEQPEVVAGDDLPEDLLRLARAA